MLNFYIFYRHWHVYNCGYQEFEVLNSKENFTVNLNNRECTCRHWQISGIPCQHGVAAIYSLYKEPEPFVSDNLKKTKFLSSYMYSIRSVGGEIMWPKTNRPPPLAPLERRMPGRPAVKRKRAAHESDGAIRSTKSRKCGNCFQYSHTTRSCTRPTFVQQPKQPVKRGRPSLNDGPSTGGGRTISGGRGGRSGRGGRNTSRGRGGRNATRGRGGRNARVGRNVQPDLEGMVDIPVQQQTG